MDDVDLIQLRFDSLDYYTLDHGQFIQELLANLQGLGLSKRLSSQLQIQLSPGSVVVQIFGPPGSQAALDALPMRYVEVMGCYARKVAPARLRPRSSGSEVSQASSGLLEAQAADLLGRWVPGTPKSEAVLSGRSVAEDRLARALFKQMARPAGLSGHAWAVVNG